MKGEIYSRITGTGSFLPGSPLSNAELIKRHGLESSDEWIIERTGIRMRYLADSTVSASDLATEACSQALEAAGKSALDVDLIIVATSTPDMIFPSTAAILQRKLGVANSSPAFDLQAVCTGFVYAITVADKFIRSGSTRCALVVGSEVFSRIMDWTDRGTCVLFGDGAGAVVLEAGNQPGILATAIHADGNFSDILCVPGQMNSGQATGDPFLRMDGPAVFKVAVKALADVGEEVLNIAGMSIDQVDWLIPHQANIRIINSTAKKLGLDLGKAIVTVDRHGNTSAASIPLALDEAVRQGRIKHGDTLLLEGVGGGFTWGAALLTF